MPNKMTPTSQAKNKTLFPQYSFLTIFSSKKVPSIQIYNFKLYNYAMYPKLLVFLHFLRTQ